MAGNCGGHQTFPAVACTSVLEVILVHVLECDPFLLGIFSVGIHFILAYLQELSASFFSILLLLIDE